MKRPLSALVMASTIIIGACSTAGAAAPAAADHAYDAAERVRALAFTAQDTSYGQVERLRAGIVLPAGASVDPVTWTPDGPFGR